jgi:nitroreductase
MGAPLMSRASQLTWAAEVAVRAPSIFNTQPWRWRVAGDVLELWADRTRQLTATDPDGRMLTLSCGAALHHALTALAAGGDRTRVDLVPDAEQPDLLARVRVIGGSVVTDSKQQLRFAAIGRRRTDRRAFGGAPVPQETLERLGQAAEENGAHLLVLGDDGVTDLAVAVSHAADSEVDDPEYRAELDRWAYRPRFSGDGVPPATVPPTGGRRVPLRDFHLHDRPDGSTVDGERDEAARFAILWGEGDGVVDWLRAGQALSAVLLEATVAGLAASPLSDVVEVAPARHLLGRALAGLGHPYLVLRFGTADPRAPEASPRRPTDAVIEPG